MFFRGAPNPRDLPLCIAIPHVERPQNYLLKTVQSLVDSDPLDGTQIAVCDFSARPSANMTEVAREFAPFIDAGQLTLARFSGEQPPLDGLVRNFGDDEARVRWRSKQAFDAAYLMQQYSGLAPYYVHLEDDMVASHGCLSAVRRIIQAAPPNWFSIKLSPLGACAIAFQSAGLEQLAAYLRLMYYEMPVDWLIDEHIDFKKRTGHPSLVKKGLFEHIGVSSSLAGQRR